jgi:hypothetical protein
MYAEKNLDILKRLQDNNRQADLSNYQEILLVESRIKNTSEEAGRTNMSLNAQIASSNNALADIERSITNLPAQIRQVSGRLWHTITHPVNPINAYRETQRRILLERDNLQQTLESLMQKSILDKTALEEHLGILNQKKVFLKDEHDAINFWLVRHAGKPLRSGLKRIEERILAGKSDFLKVSVPRISITNVSHFFNKAGGDISAEWKRLPKEVQMVIIVAASIALAYGAVYLATGAGVQTTFSLSLAQQGLSVNLLTYTVGGGIQVLPTITGIVAGVAAWQEFYRQSHGKDFEKYQTAEAEKRMKKENDEFTHQESEDIKNQRKEAESRANNDTAETDTNTSTSATDNANAKTSVSAESLAQNKPISPSSSSASSSTSAGMQPANTTNPIVPTSKEEKQLLSTIELIYNDVTAIASYVAPFAGNILIIGKALLESDSIGEPSNPYQKIIEKSVNEIVENIVRDPLIKTLINTVKKQAEFIWNFIGPDIEKKLLDKNISIESDVVSRKNK